MLTHPCDGCGGTGCLDQLLAEVEPNEQWTDSCTLYGPVAAPYGLALADALRAFVEEEEN